MATPSLSELLDASAALHRHLCPRQVLGVRMGLMAGELLGLDLPQSDKRLCTIVETDGCASDGIAVATNCWVGRRTLRVEDYGKVAATFVDTATGRAVRIVPRQQARALAHDFAREARSQWEAQLLGYQHMPPEELLSVQSVVLKTPIEQIVSRAGRKALCDICCEEILNEREIVQGGATLCRACAGQAYYYAAMVLSPSPMAVMFEMQPPVTGRNIRTIDGLNRWRGVPKKIGRGARIASGQFRRVTKIAVLSEDGWRCIHPGA